MEYFDIIIIGAGPAGLRCAEVLGNSRFSVLLIEANSQVGPKICAGGLTRKSIEYLKLPEDLLDFKYNKIKININSHSSIIEDENYFVFTIDRKILGQWQLEKVKKFNNIKFKTELRVSSIEKDYINAGGEKIKYKYLVGADGSNSIVRKHLGLKEKKLDIAIQYIIPTKNYNEFEIYYDSRLFSSWYAWVFPHKDYVSVGCGCNPRYLSSGKLMSNFKYWLKKKNFNISNARYEAFMINYDYRGYEFDNIFLIGDAGGFASGLTGEGIYPALVSGEEIAKKIINPDYVPVKLEELLKTKREHNYLLEILIKVGKIRIILFYLGVALLKISYFKKKALDFFA